MNNKFAVTSVFILLTSMAFGQLMYQKVYGDATTNKAFSVLTLTNGDIVISGQTGTGPTKDVFLIRTDSLGNMIWSKSYGTPQPEEGRVCKQTPDGGFIISGYSNSSNLDAVLIKTDMNGILQWSKKYGGIGNDFAWPLDITTAGEIYLAGWSSSTVYGGLYDAFVIKTNSTGDTLWTKMFGTSNEDYFRGLATTSDGGCIAVGETNGWSSNYDVNVVKLNSNGTTAWSKVLGNVLDIDYAWTVKQTSDGGYIVGGNSGINSGTGDILLIKLDDTGNTIWSKMIGDGNLSLNTCRSIIETSAGNLLMSGYTGNGGGNEEGIIMMLDSLGNTLWSNQYAIGDSIEHIRFINEVSPNKYIAAGYTKDNIALGDYDIYLLKIDSNGFAGGCNESSISYNTTFLSFPSISGVPSSSTNFATSILSGSTTLTYSSYTLCSSNQTTYISEESYINAKINLYPNPFSTVATLRSDTPLKNATLLIYNSFGQVVMQIKNINGQTITLARNNLASGLYFLQLTEENKTFYNDKLVITD